MIGIFDSGSGGLTFLAAMRRRYPDYDYLYFGDYDNCPYGDRTPEEIQTLTISGVQKLFDAGASIVILACNTASAWTLRRMQTEVFPERRILGVTIPGAEKVVELGLQHVMVFATEQTVKSKTYLERVHILQHDVLVDEIALPGSLVRDIESLLPIQRCHTQSDFEALLSLSSVDGWKCDSPEWMELLKRYLLTQQLSPSTRDIGGIVLGCTHYSYLKIGLQMLYPNLVIIDPSEEAAHKFEKYISRHPQAVSRVQGTGGVVFL